jgi:hypothetical protein
MKIKSIKKIILIIFFVLNLFITNKIFAASLSLDFSKKSLGAGEQFYVDLMLDPEGQSINTIKGSITFQNDYISFVRIEDGKSMVNLWVEKPTLDSDKNTVNFAGVMTNGFDGVIDPFNTKYKLPGLIIRLVFEAQKPGLVDFSTSQFLLNLNDGEGTEIQANPFYDFVKVENYVVNSKYRINTDASPELDAYVTRDPNLYNNKYIIIYKATDKGTGIKSVMIKEGNRNWIEVESPYILKDQGRHSIIYVQAMNFDGAAIVKTIEPLPYKIMTPINILIFVVICLLLFLIIKIFYNNKYKKKI